MGFPPGQECVDGVVDIVGVCVWMYGDPYLPAGGVHKKVVSPLIHRRSCGAGIPAVASRRSMCDQLIAGGVRPASLQQLWIDDSFNHRRSRVAGLPSATVVRTLLQSADR